jgi:opacity protein-like surface antigen
MHRHAITSVLIVATLAAAGALAASSTALAPPRSAIADSGWLSAGDLRLADAGSPGGDREQRAYDPPRNSWYGPSRPPRDENVGPWAIGTFYGKNGANGEEETITIRPDGSAELRTRDRAPRYGTFARETLTFDTRMSRVEPARGGIVIDGAYYRR